MNRLDQFRLAHSEYKILAIDSICIKCDFAYIAMHDIIHLTGSYESHVL